MGAGNLSESAEHTGGARSMACPAPRGRPPLPLPGGPAARRKAPHGVEGNEGPPQGFLRHADLVTPA